MLGQAVNIEALKPALGKAIAYTLLLFEDMSLNSLSGLTHMLFDHRRAKREEVAATRSRLEGVKMKASSLVGEEKSIKSRLAQLERQLQGS